MKFNINCILLISKIFIIIEFMLMIFVAPTQNAIIMCLDICFALCYYFDRDKFTNHFYMYKKI